MNFNHSILLEGLQWYYTGLVKPGPGGQIWHSQKYPPPTPHEKHVQFHCSIAEIFTRFGHRDTLGSRIYGNVLVQSLLGRSVTDTIARNIPDQAKIITAEQWNGICCSGQGGCYSSITISILKTTTCRKLQGQSLTFPVKMPSGRESRRQSKFHTRGMAGFRPIGANLGQIGHCF